MKNEIFTKEGLFTGSFSRTILRAIIDGTDTASLSLPEKIPPEKINQLKILYQNKLFSLKEANKVCPKYLPFYHIIKDRIPAFNWKFSDKNTIFEAPKVAGVRPSLLTLLLTNIHWNPLSEYMEKCKCINMLPDKIALLFYTAIKKIGIYKAPEMEMTRVIKWLLKGIAKNELTIFVPLCPDYEVEFTGNKNCPVKYTFNTLGTDNGVVGKWLAHALPVFIDFMKQCEFKFNVIVTMADFESFSEENTRRFSITEAEFMRRIKKSALSFSHSCSIAPKVVMFTELFGRTAWDESYSKMTKRLTHDDFGKSDLSIELLNEIVKKRKALYQRWFGAANSSSNYQQALIEQGAAYASMGALLAQKFENCLIFAADAKVMRHFYSVAKPYPCLYLNKNYA